jgi:hypothetical protein
VAGVPLLLVIAIAALVGRTLGALVFAAYLILADIVRGDVSENANNVFVAQSLTEYKNFLRLRLDAAGGMTVFPLGIDSVPHKWRLEPNGPPGDPWFVPTDAEVGPHLIEPPISLR